MASSDDFREQLKAGNITEALALALSKAVELKVTTWVASGTDDAEAAEAKPGHRLRTHLNHIEGKIENEIGDQFIGNGPYRELRQFHLDQIAEGNKIIQNNLKSLHKLFEVWVAMRYQSATPPVIEPESLGVESQLLPPTEDIAEAGLGLAQTEPGVAGFVVSPNTVIQEDVAQEPPLPSGEPSSFLTTPADTEEALDSETDDDDDWDDSILDLLESLPIGSPPSPEALDSQIDEDWGDFIEEEPGFDPAASEAQGNQDWEIFTLEDLEPRPAEAEPNIEASTSEIDEDFGDLIEQELDLDPVTSDSQGKQDWGTLTLEDLESLPVSDEPNIDASTSEIDEDFGDFIEEELDLDPVASDSQENEDGEILTQQELEPRPAEAEPKIEASTSEIDDDWGWEDLIEEESDFELAASDLQGNQDRGILTQQELESPSAEAEPTIKASISEIDQDWGDFIEEEPDFEPTASDLQRNQDEEILTQQELESPSAEAEPIIKGSTSEIDEDWGDLIEQKPETEQDKPVRSLASLDLEEDDEWDDWVVEEPSLLLDEPLADMDSLDLGEDDDWDDFAVESNPFSVEPAVNWSESDLEIDEDWDDFAAEELEPYSGVLDVDISFDQSDPLEDLNPRESALDHTDTPDLSKHLKRDSSTDKGSLEELDQSPQMPEMTNQSEEAANAPREVLWGETDPLSAEPEPGIFDDGGVYDLEEGLFIQKPHKPLSAEAHGLADSEAADVANASRSRSQEDSERGVAAEESESLAISSDDLDAKPKPVERRVPPPPPPSRFPNQNN